MPLKIKLVHTFKIIIYLPEKLQPPPIKNVLVNKGVCVLLLDGTSIYSMHMEVPYRVCPMDTYYSQKFRLMYTHSSVFEQCLFSFVTSFLSSFLCFLFISLFVSCFLVTVGSPLWQDKFQEFRTKWTNIQTDNLSSHFYFPCNFALNSFPLIHVI